MSLINKVCNAFSPHNLARVASKCGSEGISTNILVSNYGKQFGKTSKSGLRAFSYKGKDNNQYITLIDKNFEKKALTILSRKSDGELGQVDRFFFNDEKTTHTFMRKYYPSNSWGHMDLPNVKIVHRIDEYGRGVERRTGLWSTILPNSEKTIVQNDNHILDYLF